MKKLILAGGCFWGLEAFYQRVKGVTKTSVGYTDCNIENPTYEEVCRGIGHVEACYLEYDENIVSLEKILDYFFAIIDPTTKNAQGNDIGIQYRSAIFFYDKNDEIIIKDTISKIKNNYSKEIATYYKEATFFYQAEEYHQNYLRKNPKGYCHINLDILNKK